MVDVPSTQLWAYDDISAFQATQSSQPELSTQFGKAPAAAFCPSCGALTLDVADTEAGREAHVRDCRDSGEPEADGAHSDGEDSPEVPPESSSGAVQGSSDEPAQYTKPKRKAMCQPFAEEDTNNNAKDAVRLHPSADSSTANPADSESQQQRESSDTDENRVQQWLQDNGLADQAEAFKKAHITPDLLRFLVDEDLHQMGVSALGPCRRILAAIQNIPASRCRSNPVDSCDQVALNTHACRFVLSKLLQGRCSFSRKASRGF